MRLAILKMLLGWFSRCEDKGTATQSKYSVVMWFYGRFCYGDPACADYLHKWECYPF